MTTDEIISQLRAHGSALGDEAGKRLADLRDAAIWMSAAEAFAPDGKARSGFESIVLPLLK